MQAPETAPIGPGPDAPKLKTGGGAAREGKGLGTLLKRRTLQLSLFFGILVPGVLIGLDKLWLHNEKVLEELLAPTAALLIGLIGATVMDQLDSMQTRVDSGDHANEIKAEFENQAKSLIQSLGELKEAHIDLSSRIERLEVESKASLPKLNTLVLRDKELSGLTPIHVAVSNFSNFFIYVPFYAAQQLDFFKEEDITVTVRNTGNDNKAFDDVLDGNAQFAITDPRMVRDKIDKNDHNREEKRKQKQARIIAPFVRKAALWGLSQKDPSSPGFLRPGGKIVTYPNPSTAYRLVKRWLARNKAPDYEILQLSTEEIVLKADQLLAECDLICVTEPERTWFQAEYSKLNLKELDFHSVLFGDANPFDFTVVLTTAEHVRYNNAAVKRFLRALRLACSLVCGVEQHELSYGRIVDAAWEQSISTYPERLKEKLNKTMSREIFERLRKSGYFSSGIVYGSGRNEGLINALELGDCDGCWSTTEITNDMLVRADKEFNLFL